MVHYGLVGFVGRGEGADRVDESARGSRKVRTASKCTKLLQKHWEWQENRNKELESFDVSKPSVVSKFLSLSGTHVLWWPLSVCTSCS